MVRGLHNIIGDGGVIGFERGGSLAPVDQRFAHPELGSVGFREVCGDAESKLLPGDRVVNSEVVDRRLTPPDKPPGTEGAINLIASVHQSHDSFHLSTQSETSSQDGFSFNLVFSPLTLKGFY